MALESALLLQLVKTIRWGSATVDGQQGTLAPINPVSIFDVTQYAGRDRALAYRDVINAFAAVQVSLQISNVWNSPVLQPRMQAAPTSAQLPYIPAQAGQLTSQVMQVKNVSVPINAVSTDQDLYGRDAVLYQALATACQLFQQPPLTPIVDQTGTIVSTDAWSQGQATYANQGEGLFAQQDGNIALPLNQPLFANPDEWLAGQDNQVAAYAARIIQTLQNPFAYATRIYVQTEGADVREPDIYTLSYPYWQSGVFYPVGSQVFYNNAYYQASYTTSAVPFQSGVIGASWFSISSPTVITFLAEPSLPGRNQIIYDTVKKTLQWCRESGELVHVPQIYALSIPGIVLGQTINTLTEAPQAKDEYYYAQKAQRIVFGGSLAVPVTSPGAVYNSGLLYPTGNAVINTTPVLDNGVLTACFTASGSFQTTFNNLTLSPGNYRVSLLARPDDSITVPIGKAFSGLSPALGSQILTQVPLPAGIWQLQFDYSNLSGSTSGFWVQVEYGQNIIYQGVYPMQFVDSLGNPLPNGTLAQSPVITFRSDGVSTQLKITWVAGTGQMLLNNLYLSTQDVPAGIYAFSGTFGGNSSNLEVIGHAKVPEVFMFGDFSLLNPVQNPVFSVFWAAGSNVPHLPLVIPSISIFQVLPTSAVLGYPVTPALSGFEGFKQSMLDRSSVATGDSYREALNTLDNFPTFSTGGTNGGAGGTWETGSTETYMRTLQIFSERLISEQVLSGFLQELQEYSVVGSSGASVSYNGGFYSAGQNFVAQPGVSTYGVNGSVAVLRTGAFTRSQPGHVGLPALVPDGLEYVLNAGTLLSNYGTRWSVPTIQILAPWMVEYGFYVAVPAFNRST